MTGDARWRSLARLSLALSRIGRRSPPLPPRRRPPSAGAIPAEPPRTPTLTGGAAAPID